jgi:hypothetical protein
MNNKERRKVIRQLQAELAGIRGRVWAMREEEKSLIYGGALEDAALGIDKASFHLSELLSGW